MPSLDDEVAYISGLSANGTLASVAYDSWDGNNPATYSPPYNQAAKWLATPSSNLAGTPGGTVNYYFNPASNWNATEEQDFSAGLALWAAVANISFVQTTNPAAAQITITRGTDGNAETSTTLAGPADAGLIGGTKLLQITSANISIDTSVAGFGPIGTSFTTYGGYPWEALLHEEGHALGLEHGGPYPFTGVSNSSTLQYSPYDSRLWTIMSYIDPFDTTAADYSQYPVTGTNWGLSPVAPDGHIYHNEATTLMPVDILAIQRIYGLPTSTPLFGGQVFGFNSNITGPIAPFFDFTKNITPVVTVWDMGSNNTLNLTGFSSGSNVNLNPGTFSSCDGLTNNICIAFNTAIDSLYDDPGNDVVVGNNDGDYINGEAGNDTITGGAGNDTLVGGTGINTLNGGGGTNTAAFSDNRAAYTITYNADGSITVSNPVEVDTLTNIQYLSFSDGIIPAVQNMVLIGGNGNDTLIGGPGNDVLRGGLGTNTLDGGPGIDTAAFSLAPNYYYVTATSTGYQIQGPGETDTLTNIEQASFDQTGQTLSLAQFAAQSFNPLAYIASYPDLIQALGDNPTAGVTHFDTAGYYEGRSSGTFNALQYTASYSDLIKALGDNQTAANEHYIKYGYYEGRNPGTFNALQYTASYSDLIKALGDNQTAAYEHYIKYGYYEGRSTGTFNALEYTASYSDLIKALGDNQTAAYEHYIKYGYYEGRSTGIFNALEYTASYSDLIKALGDNQTAAYEHYIKYGYYEGRSTGTFNALDYTASYSDLIKALGDNQTAAYEHFIKYGYYEGRTVTFDPVAYLLSYTDLQNAGLTAQTAAAHYIDAGFNEGRSASGAFGNEQTQHALTLGTALSDSLTSGDKDWFSINLTAGQSYDLSMSGSTLGNLADPFLELHNSHGVLLASDNDSGPGTDALIHFTAASTGLYYLVAASNVPGAAGNYKIMAASA